MTDIIIAFDDQDTRLGIFFNRCAEILLESMDETWNCISIDSNELNDLYLQIQIAGLQGNFVFASFTHGSDSSLVSLNIPFLQCPIAENYLINSFSYCFACFSGQLLGRELIQKGTHSFIGYSDQVTFVIGFVDDFASCAVEGLLSFKNGTSINDSLARKKEKYSEQIDALYKDHFFAASELMNNRDCLILHGNGDLRNTDFSY